MYIHTSICAYIYRQIYIYVCIYRCICIVDYFAISLYAEVYVYVYIYILIYACIYLFIRRLLLLFVSILQGVGVTISMCTALRRRDRKCCSSMLRR